VAIHFHGGPGGNIAGQSLQHYSGIMAARRKEATAVTPCLHADQRHSDVERFVDLQMKTLSAV